MPTYQALAGTVTAASADPHDILEALANHLNRAGSLHVADLLADGGINKTLRIRSKTSGENWEYILSSINASAGYLAGSLEPVSQAVTDVDPTAGASAENSGQAVRHMALVAAKMEVIEYDNALCILGYHATDSYFPGSCMGGRVMTPIMGNGSELGCDGLGILGNRPQFSTSYSIANHEEAILSYRPTNHEQCSRLRMGEALWGPASFVDSSLAYRDFGGGRNIPGPVVIRSAFSGASLNSARPVGVANHLALWDTARASGEQVQSPLEAVAWMHAYYTSNSEKILFRYEFGKAPTFGP